MSSIALASGPNRDVPGTSLVDGLVNWTRDTASDLWQTRKFSLANAAHNVVKHGWKKGLERQAQEMNDASGALVRTGARTAAIGAIIATKGAAAKPVAVLSHVIKDQTGFEPLPDVVSSVTAIGAEKGAKAAAQDVVGKMASVDVSGWRESKRPAPAPEPSMAATP